VIIGLHDVGGWNGLTDGIKESNIGEAGLHALEGTQPGNVTNPIGSSWIGLVFGLVLFAESADALAPDRLHDAVQGALEARRVCRLHAHLDRVKGVADW
jgi:hypothetical protein